MARRDGVIRVRREQLLATRGSKTRLVSQFGRSRGFGLDVVLFGELEERRPLLLASTARTETRPMVRLGSAGAAMAHRDTRPPARCEVTKGHSRGLRSPEENRAESSGCGITGAGQILCCWVDPHAEQTDSSASREGSVSAHDPFQVDAQEDDEPESAR